MPQVISFGELLVDMVSAADVTLGEAQQFLKAPGGAPANVAVGLQRLGVHARFIGQVGADPFGDWLRETVAQENVDVEYLLHSPEARTTIAFVATRRDGKKDICFYRNPGADALLSPDAITDQLFEDARIFHCGSLSLSENPCREAQFKAARMAREKGVLVSFDPNWRPSVWLDHQEAHRLIWQMMEMADVVKVADEEWEFVTGTSDFAEGSRKIMHSGPRLVVVTRGAGDAYFHCSNADGNVSGFAVDAVDTLGAGDAFVAGLLAQLWEYSSLEEALNEKALRTAVRFAHACGAHSTRTAGAIPSLPSRDEAELFLRNS